MRTPSERNWVSLKNKLQEAAVGAEGGNVKFMQKRHLEVDFALHGEEPQQEISLTEAQNKNKVRA